MPFTIARGDDSLLARRAADQFTHDVDAALQRDTSVRWMPIPTRGDNARTSGYVGAKCVVAGALRLQPPSGFQLRWRVVNAETSEVIVGDTVAIGREDERQAAQDLAAEISVALHDRQCVRQR